VDSTDQTIGFSFTADVSLTVSALGFWDSTTSPFAQSHGVGLWTSTGTLLTSATVLVNGPLTGDWRYVDILPVTLLAGQTYFAGSEIYSPLTDPYSRVDAIAARWPQAH
jgi:hypothetical protein